MSKFFRALEQAKRDRALRIDARPEPIQRAVTSQTATLQSAAVPTPDPRANANEGLDERLVSLVSPAAFEAEQYRALRHIVEQLHRTANLKVIAVSSHWGSLMFACSNWPCDADQMR